MEHKLTDPVALDMIADLLASGTLADAVVDDIADIVKATGRAVTYEE